MLFLTTFLLPLMVHAETHYEDLRVWRRAKVVADGHQVFSMQSSLQDISQRFSADGFVEALGRPYSQAVTWNGLKNAKGASASDVSKFMRDNGLKGSDIAATSNYDIDQQELGFGMNWAYGIWKNWMIGAQIPFTYRTVRVRQDVQMTPILAQGSPVGKNARDIRANIQSVAQQQLTEAGYDRVPAERTSWDFGDVSLLSQVQLYDSYHWTWSTQQVLRFPTEQNPALGDYIPTVEESGPLAVGASSMLDYQFRGGIAGWRIGYLVQMPDSVRMRAPADSTGATEIDPVVHRDLGNWTWTSADVEFRVLKRVDMSVEQSYWYKSPDHYSGSVFQTGDYAQLGDDSEQEIHQTRLGLLFQLSQGISRVAAGRWVAALDYTYPWIGRNSIDAARTSLEISNSF